MKFRKIEQSDKTFDAFKWTGGLDQVEDPEWFCELLKSNQAHFDKDNRCMVFTCPNSGIVRRAFVGDYIVKNMDGNFFKCAAEYFEKDYAPIDEAASFHETLCAINNEIISTLRALISNQEEQIGLLNEKIELISKQKSFVEKLPNK